MDQKTKEDSDENSNNEDYGDLSEESMDNDMDNIGDEKDSDDEFHDSEGKVDLGGVKNNQADKKINGRATDDRKSSKKNPKNQTPNPQSNKIKSKSPNISKLGNSYYLI